MTDPASAATISIIESGYSHYIIIGCSVAGIAWGGINAMFVSLSHTFSLQQAVLAFPSYERKLTL